MSTTAPTRSRLPLVVYILAIGTFLMGTTEFIVAGLLNEISADLHVTDAQAGLLVTIFALGMIVGAPIFVVLTMRLSRRVALVSALVLFAVAHLVIALSSFFPLLLASRFVAATATGAFWSVAMVVATRAVSAGSSARALGIVVGGGTLANVAGVPVGAFLGQLLGWRGPFWVLTGLAVVIGIVVLKMVPADKSAEAVSLRSEVSGLRSGRLWIAYAACGGIMGAVLGAYTFIAPLLTDVAHVPAPLLPVILVIFGIGSFIGVTLGGRVGDAHPYRSSITFAIITTVSLALLAVFAGSGVLAVTFISLAALAGFAVNPPVISLALDFGKKAPTLAATLSSSAFNTGTAISSGLAGLTLGTSLGLQGPPVVGALFGIATLVPLVTLAVLHVKSKRQPSHAATDSDLQRA